MKKILVLFPIVAFLLSSCDFSFDFDIFEDEQPEIKEPTAQEILDAKFQSFVYSNDEWVEICKSNQSLFFTTTQNFDKNITVSLPKDFECYQNIEVVIYSGTSKGYSESRTYTWKCNSDGQPTVRNMDFSCWLTGSKSSTFVGFSRAIGKVRCKSHSLLKDEEGFIYTRTSKIENKETIVTYTLIGSSVEFESDTVRLPEGYEGMNLKRAGDYFVDFPGFKNVKNLIVPKNYSQIAIDREWLSARNLENIFLESGEYPYFEFSAFTQYLYSEDEPDFSSPHKYWHYVDGQPTIWENNIKQ